MEGVKWNDDMNATHHIYQGASLYLDKADLFS